MAGQHDCAIFYQNHYDQFSFFPLLLSSHWHRSLSLIWKSKIKRLQNCRRSSAFIVAYKIIKINSIFVPRSAHFQLVCCDRKNKKSLAEFNPFLLPPHLQSLLANIDNLILFFEYHWIDAVAKNEVHENHCFYMKASKKRRNIIKDFSVKVTTEKVSKNVEASWIDKEENLHRFSVSTVLSSDFVAKLIWHHDKSFDFVFVSFSNRQQKL